MVVHAFSASTLEAEARDFSEFKARWGCRETLSQKKNNNKKVFARAMCMVMGNCNFSTQEDEAIGLVSLRPA